MLVSVSLDIIKILISVALLFVSLESGQDNTKVSVVDLRTQMFTAP